MAISEENDKYKKFNKEYRELITEWNDKDEQVSRELNEKGIMTGLDGGEDYYKANKDWFNREFEKLRKKYGVELKK